jgi:hypothetical protein
MSGLPIALAILRTADLLKWGTFMQDEHLYYLQSQLTLFGLNPHEWTLKKMRHLQVKIEHRFDRGFVFLGIATKKQNSVKWKNLKLLSL